MFFVSITSCFIPVIKMKSEVCIVHLCAPLIYIFYKCVAWASDRYFLLAFLFDEHRKNASRQVSSQLTKTFGADGVRQGSNGWIPKNSNDKQYIKVRLSDRGFVDPTHGASCGGGHRSCCSPSLENGPFPPVRGGNEPFWPNG